MKRELAILTRPLVAALFAAALASTSVAVEAQSSMTANGLPNSLGTSHDFLGWGRTMLGAGMMDAIEAKERQVAIKGVLDGSYEPTATFVASADVQSQLTDGFAQKMSAGHQFPGGISGARAYAVDRLADYRRTVGELGEPADNVVTGCEYFVVAAVLFGLERTVDTPTRRSMRGLCVLYVAELQATRKIETSVQRQTLTDVFALYGAAAQEQNAASKSASERDALRTTLASAYTSFFGSDLDALHLDDLACAGVATPSDRAACRKLASNQKLAAIADRAK